MTWDASVFIDRSLDNQHQKVKIPVLMRILNMVRVNYIIVSNIADLSSVGKSVTLRSAAFMFLRLIDIQSET